MRLKKIWWKVVKGKFMELGLYVNIYIRYSKVKIHLLTGITWRSTHKITTLITKQLDIDSGAAYQVSAHYASVRPSTWQSSTRFSEKLFETAPLFVRRKYCPIINCILHRTTMYLKEAAINFIILSSLGPAIKISGQSIPKPKWPRMLSGAPNDRS